MHRTGLSIRRYLTNVPPKQLLPPTIRSVIQNDANLGNTITLSGWVKSVRTQKNVSFATITDGSTLKGIQAILPGGHAEKLSTGTCVEVNGVLQTSPGTEQNKELHIQNIRILGECDNTYPLQKKRHSLEFLRSIGHLRARGNTGGAVLRVRNAASHGLHKFFADNDFIHVNTPILTSHDCEGAGEVFNVFPATVQGKSQEFFKKPVYLTVSGQLHAEILASSLSRVYTFGPVFRAEASMTSRHLAEFWMLEAEIAFVDRLDHLLDIVEASIQQSAHHVLQSCEEDLAFFNQWVDKHLLEKLYKSIEKPFVRITYTEAIKMLQNASKTFTFNPQWGSSLQIEHERYLASECFGHPVFVTDYPSHLKPFYMLSNDDSKTVSCFDLLVPGIGELIGGSLREHRYDVLKRRMEETNMNLEDYQWYLDLRKYGSAPHGGYGIGAERLLLWLTGLENVREVIPMPRWVGHCKF